MKNFKTKANILILSFIIFSYIIPPVFGIVPKVRIEYTIGQDNLNFILNEKELNENSKPISINKWEDIILKVDQNANGINDQLENKLELLSEINTLKTSNSDEGIINNDVDLIIQFPKDYDYSTALRFYENNGGNIKYKYKYTINGFSGSIDYQSLMLFYNQLRENNIKFFMEGDDFGNMHLYYNSRNMRLRPYIWDTLGYTGDNYSSIAILDTGIDEDHKYFDNATTGKVLAWVDFTTNGDNSTAYDDNGHGSHVAGIAAGLGTTEDFEGRAVATGARNVQSIIDLDDGSGVLVVFAQFNVPSYGGIEIECEFNDSTPLPDYTIADFYLLRDYYIMTQLGRTTPGDWQNNMTYIIDSSDELGVYIVAGIITFKDGGIDGYCSDANSTVRAEVHWPFDPNDYGSGNLWKGVAPDANLVAVKVFDKHGGAESEAVSLSDAIMGIEWCIANRKVYNITVMSMSFGFDDEKPNLIAAVNSAVEYGIVAVASAGNDYSGGNNLGCPADSDNVITVAANNFNDRITEYSSQGGNSSTDETIKPDITAPGGSWNDFQMFSADTNDNDAEGASIDDYTNDLWGAQGTSMSCPVVAGAANLLIQAFREDNNWNWDGGNTSKLIKSILLMTATETYPLKREEDTSFSPPLNRGGKDVHEGYGRLNIDAAIEAWTNDLTGKDLNPTLYSSVENSYDKHAYAGYVNLNKDQPYVFNLTVPAGKDYDLYLYNSTPNDYGEPVLLNSSISPALGRDESINFTAPHTGKFFLVAKAIGIPSVGGDGDDDDEEKVTIIDLTLIAIISAIIALIAIIIVVIAYKKSKKDYTYDFRPEY